jgi:hypothetical protein
MRGMGRGRRKPVFCWHRQWEKEVWIGAVSLAVPPDFPRDAGAPSVTLWSRK